MTKTFCDACKKEIPEAQARVTASTCVGGKSWELCDACLYVAISALRIPFKHADACPGH